MLQPGSVFAGYTIERMLGRGGMGSVYLAKHPRLPRSDALKLLSADYGTSSTFRARFEREADVAARMHHPNVVAVHDRGVEGGQLWIAMQFIDGTDVAELVSIGPRALPGRRVVSIIADAAKGLDHAHRFGLLHRDVKPANILVTRAPDEPTGERALITDFGIARAIDETRHFTETGDVLATIAYAAPEQLEGHAVDHRADVYALGCTLFEMLTGHTPFPRENPLAVIKAHLVAPPPRATESVPTLPPAIDAVIARALAKNPAQRFDSCRELAGAAAAALAVPLAPIPEPEPPRRAPGPTVIAPAYSEPVKKRSNTRKVLAGVAAVAVVAAVGTGVALAARSSDSTAAPRTTAQASGSPATTAPTTENPPSARYRETAQRVQGSTSTATYDVTIPHIEGGNPAVAAEFNESMRSALQDQIDGYGDEAFTLVGGDSAVTHIGDHVVSGLLLTSWNADPPGAHPSPLLATIVVNGDSGEPITLDDLFTDTDAGLAVLSEQAAQLLPETAAGPDFFELGIEPTMDNFANWLATPAGMELHFTDGQVGPHAVGLVVVTVPWSDLADVLAPGMAAIVSS
ncbi:protein kinase [Antrihabitans sp. YC2-6]|uniref:protein kinase domain-containing protein n=1 Tax=Antrihabitans sp. YC2-6 TaxID=2799498 RepID=UPI001F2E6B5E|nr:protein kinase [Antrihabitans sp. YC2-6]